MFDDIDDTDLLDNDGYPTDYALEKIKNFKFTEERKAIDLIKELWYYPDCAKEVKKDLFVFATGGWSGNELLMNALKKSEIWLLLHWRSLYVPGGLYIFDLDVNHTNIDELFKYITSWAWNDDVRMVRND